MRRRDAAQTAAVGIAAATALLVAGGLGLHVLDALGTAGWIAVALVAVAIAILAASRDPGRLLAPVLLGTVAVGLAAGAVALSHASAVDHARETRFTQLWMVQDGPGRRAEIGVSNQEGRRAEFLLQVFAPVSAGGPPLVDRRLVLEPGESWSRVIRVPRTRSPERVNAELYRDGSERSYRSAHVWTRSSR